MTELLWAAIYGIVQGLTEFLPISSSGHLVALHALAPLPLSDPFAFDVALHIGTLAALAAVFWRDIWNLLIGFVRSCRTRTWWHQGSDGRLAWLIILGTIPAVIVGGLWGDALEEFRAVPIVAGLLIGVGLLFFVAERWGQKQRHMNDLTWVDSLLIGCAQACALIPGVSRSGSTIIAGLGRGFERESATRFSFLLSLPAVTAAAVLEIIHYIRLGQAPSNSGVFAVGVLAAALSGTIAIRLLLRFVQRHSISVFGWYRIALGTALLWWWLFLH